MLFVFYKYATYDSNAQILFQNYLTYFEHVYSAE